MHGEHCTCPARDTTFHHHFIPGAAWLSLPGEQRGPPATTTCSRFIITAAMDAHSPAKLAVTEPNRFLRSILMGDSAILLGETAVCSDLAPLITLSQFPYLHSEPLAALIVAVPQFKFMFSVVLGPA